MIGVFKIIFKGQIEDISEHKKSITFSILANCDNNLVYKWNLTESNKRQKVSKNVLLGILYYGYYKRTFFYLFLISMINVLF